MLELKKISKKYGRVTALKSVNITLGSGIYALLGPNGSGKSTMMNIIAGILPPSDGEVLYNGQSIRSLGLMYREKIGYMPQYPGMYPSFTARDFLLYMSELKGLRRGNESEVDYILRRVELDDCADRKISALSGGMKQRLSLAQAVLGSPEIIILDEPTSFLDIRHKLELLAILRRMAKEKGITVIMSLHEIDLAQKISDKIICVKGDAISHFGAPETIFREDIIRELYEIDNGSFDPCFGSIELPRPEGTPRVFVLAGGGTGIPVFRKLQKENVPFAAGVLYTNDIDYQLARILAMETVTEAPFQEISDEAFARACELMKSCERVIDTGVPVGMCNRRIEELRAEAKRLGKLAE